MAVAKGKVQRRKELPAFLVLAFGIWPVVAGYFFVAIAVIMNWRRHNPT